LLIVCTEICQSDIKKSISSGIGPSNHILFDTLKSELTRLGIFIFTQNYEDYNPDESLDGHLVEQIFYNPVSIDQNKITELTKLLNDLTGKSDVKLDTSERYQKHKQFKDLFKVCVYDLVADQTALKRALNDETIKTMLKDIYSHVESFM
jgi:hypothetical protein